VDAGRAVGSPIILGVGATYVAMVEHHEGRWSAARAGFAAVERLATDLTPRLVWLASAHLAELAAARGDAEECRRYATQAAELHGGYAAVGVLGRGQLGLLALGQGHYHEAVEQYDADVLLYVGEITLYREVADAAEAYLRAGEARRAEIVVGTFAEQAHASGIPAMLGRLAHLRGIAAAESEYTSHFAEALEWHARDGAPFARARTHLAYGERLRRDRRRDDAREQLRAALRAFETLGAAPWAERAAHELRATGERVRTYTRAGEAALTPQELHIALLVARGATNKQAAAHLFLSPKTIEKHLGHVYAKLAVRSRTELAHVLAGTAAAQDTAAVVSRAE
jgi:DNA-binding CsgD family transcriptional regulator